MALKTHGITNDTINNIMLNAGVFYKNLTYTGGEWTGTVVGATSGGGTINIEPEYLDVEVDGATVAVKGLTKQKVGETATMEMNLTELTEGVVVKALNLVEDSSKSNEAYTCYTTKTNIDTTDYLKNVAFVGTTTAGRHIIAIFPNAICTSAFSLSGQNKTQATYTVQYQCTASLESDNLTKLPIELYFPVIPTDGEPPLPKV